MGLSPCIGWGQDSMGLTTQAEQHRYPYRQEVALAHFLFHVAAGSHEKLHCYTFCEP